MVVIKASLLCLYDTFLYIKNNTVCDDVAQILYSYKKDEVFHKTGQCHLTIM